MNLKNKVQVCEICGGEMLRRYWSLHFKIKRRFIQVTNYPLHICPFCGEQQLNEKATKKVLSKLSRNYLSAVKVYANYSYLKN